MDVFLLMNHLRGISNIKQGVTLGQIDRVKVHNLSDVHDMLEVPAKQDIGFGNMISATVTEEIIAICSPCRIS
jgi:hypothetical protein